METNRKREAIAPVAGIWRVLAAFLAIALSASAMGRAQVKPAQPEPVAAPSQPTPEAQPAAAASRSTPASESQPKGSREGIQVHGHWTIEVKNPDGKLVTHSEFENGLSSSNVGGATLLAGILAGTVTPGSWMVFLEDPLGLDAIMVAQPGSAAAGFCPEYLSSLEGSQDVGSCSDNLSVTGAVLTPPGSLSGGLSGTTVTLTGSGTVPKGFPATIGSVQTVDLVCLPSLSPATCFNVPSGGSKGSVTNTNLPLTARDLDGKGTDPKPVPVTVGQTVAVKVVLSFGSGQ